MAVGYWLEAEILSGCDCVTAESVSPAETDGNVVGLETFSKKTMDKVKI